MPQCEPAARTVGTGRFLTDNESDFPKSITEIEIAHPGDLPDATRR